MEEDVSKSIGMVSDLPPSIVTAPVVSMSVLWDSTVGTDEAPATVVAVTSLLDTEDEDARFRLEFTTNGSCFGNDATFL